MTPIERWEEDPIPAINMPDTPPCRREKIASIFYWLPNSVIGGLFRMTLDHPESRLLRAAWQVSERHLHMHTHFGRACRKISLILR